MHREVNRSRRLDLNYNNYNDNNIVLRGIMKGLIKIHFNTKLSVILVFILKEWLNNNAIGLEFKLDSYFSVVSENQFFGLITNVFIKFLHLS